MGRIARYQLVIDEGRYEVQVRYEVEGRHEVEARYEIEGHHTPHDVPRTSTFPRDTLYNELRDILVDAKFK